MKMELIASGKQPPNWVTDGFSEYQRRLPPECALFLTECSTAKRIKGGRAADYQSAEEQVLLRQIKAGSFVVALDKSGRQVSTEDLSSRLSDWMLNYPKVQFLIGGPDGLSQNCLARADWVLSLSTLTFPHFMVRVLVAEQLYRAWSILKNHPYHK